MTSGHDLNLLAALDALLQHGSVTLAAAHVGITAPAMSRALGRLRIATGDPILVRAGRQMVLTPHAVSLRDRARAATREAIALLGRPATRTLRELERTFTVRASDAAAAILSGPLHDAVRQSAPGVRVRFVPEGDEDALALRDGRVDLDVGVVDHVEPELRIQRLADDRFVGLVRRGHRLLRGRVTARAFAGAAHLVVSRVGKRAGPIDAALEKLGLSRDVSVVVPSFLTAAFAVASSDLVATVPGSLAAFLGTNAALRSFELPLSLPSIAIAQVWHPRLDVDPAHRWLRERVRDVTRALTRTPRRRADPHVAGH